MSSCVEDAPASRLFLVLVIGYAAAGKSTLAPLLAQRLEALWVSRDTIHEMVYSGWEPTHPARTSPQYDPEIGGSTFHEGRVVWQIFLWTLARVTNRVPVVADTPFNHSWNRAMFAEAAGDIVVPIVEVVLEGDPVTLLAWGKSRAARGDVPEIMAWFSVRSLEYYAEPYRPVLGEDRVVRVDTTHLDRIDLDALATSVKSKLAERSGAERSG